jgi:hypothetical protein
MDFMPPPDERTFDAPLFFATEPEVFALRGTDAARIELEVRDGRAGADLTGQRAGSGELLHLLFFYFNVLCRLMWNISRAIVEMRLLSGWGAVARVGWAPRLQEVGLEQRAETRDNRIVLSLNRGFRSIGKGVSLAVYIGVDLSSGGTGDRRLNRFRQPMEGAVRFLRRGTVSLVAW